MRNKYVIVIPARYKSSRFPGKPLVDICGKSMIQRVWEKCCLALPRELVFVATDDSRIANHCEALDIQVIMTPAECLTGTDRIYHVSKVVDAEIYINVQGDEPLIDPSDIKKIIDESQMHPDCIINAMCPIDNEADFRSASVPKVVSRPDGRLLYMSRTAVPTNKRLEFVEANKQVCIYAFPKQSLCDYTNNGAKSYLENIEDIEILRFLELGYDVKMIKVSTSSIAVDFPDDVKRVEEVLLAKVE